VLWKSGRRGAPATLALLSGCIAVGKIDQRAVRLNEQIADTQNRGVLMNIVRASHEEPLYFMAFNQLSGSGTTDFRVGVPQFYAGPKLPPADKIATFTGGATFLDNQTNTNFQVSVLGSKDFYNGLMAPLSLRDVDLLLHQGYSRELIFYLVIAKAKITFVPGPGEPERLPVVVYNDPSNGPSFSQFETYIRQAMEHGLTTQTYETESGGGDDADPKKRAAAAHVEAELCYDKALANPTNLGHIPKGGFCGDQPASRKAGAESAGAPLYVTLNGQRLQIEVTTRSIFEIFYYLGRIVNSRQAVNLQAFEDLPAERIAAEPLIEVQEGGHYSDDGGNCFTEVSYERQTYCVPVEGAANTKRIFGILNALLALKQSNSDLPTTQTVRIAQ
jgi:hypothetical protein